MDLLLVGIGGGLGAICRYLVTLWAVRRYGTGFPLGTLVVNIFGSFLLALIVGLVGHQILPPFALLLVGTGFCGGLTTFSTFSYESLQIYRQSKNLTSLLRNWLANVLPGLASALLALYLISL